MKLYDYRDAPVEGQCMSTDTSHVYIYDIHLGSYSSRLCSYTTRFLDYDAKRKNIYKYAEFFSKNKCITGTSRCLDK